MQVRNRYRARVLFAIVSMAVGAMLIAAFVSASALPSPAAETQISTPRPGQQVALVTGSPSGLGRELALRLGSIGMHIIVHGRNRERGMDVVEAIESQGIGSARFYRADLASFEEVREFGEAILRDYGRLDVLINNAGIASAPTRGPFRRTATSYSSR